MRETRYIDEIQGKGKYKLDKRASPPPICLISVDMIPPEVYGRGRYAPYLETPNLDRLQRDGVWFEHAFCNAPLCGPSRASYLTGRYPYITVNEERAHDGNATELQADDVLFPEYLKSAGYITRHVGKCHVGPKKFIDAFGENDTPWNRWAPPIYDDDAYVNYIRKLGVERFTFARSIQGLQQDRKTAGNLYGGWLVQENGAPFPLEATYPYYLAHKAVQTLEAIGRTDQPFYLQLDFFAPHQPFMIPSGLEEREHELRELVTCPESYEELLARDFARGDHEPLIYDTYRRSWGLYDPSTLRDYIIANLLQIEVVDKALRLFLDALDTRGLYDRCMMVFMGDHGEMNGEGGLIDKGVYGHPKVIQVPLFLKMPDKAHAGERIDSSVCLLDLAPTLLDLAGVEPVDRMDGESLLPLIQGQKKEREQDFIFEAGWHVAPNPAVALQQQLSEGHFLYTYNLTSEYDELYDLNDSSYRNLAFDASYDTIKATMIRRLGIILERDKRWRCYWHTFRLHQYRYLNLPAGDQQMFIPE